MYCSHLHVCYHSSPKQVECPVKPTESIGAVKILYRNEKRWTNASEKKIGNDSKDENKLQTIPYLCPLINK